MIWCHACQKETTESQYSKTCAKCGSWAIEQCESNDSSPMQFRPFTIGEPEQSEPQQNQNENQEVIEIPITFNIRTVVMESRDRPGEFTVIRMISRGLPVFPETRSPVSKESIDKMEKVENVHDCTICQEEGGNGIKLKCNHSFHRNCIEPWFEQTNTCPTCRAPVQ